MCIDNKSRENFYLRERNIATGKCYPAFLDIFIFLFRKETLITSPIVVQIDRSKFASNFITRFVRIASFLSDSHVALVVDTWNNSTEMQKENCQNVLKTHTHTHTHIIV